MLPLLLLPGALTVYLSFNSGGYFPGATSLAALLVALIFLVRVVAARDPFAGLSLPLAVAAGGLLLLGLWMLVSASWSDSSGRAVLDFNRVLLYAFTLVLFGSLARTPARVRMLLWGVTGAMVAVCTAGLLTRLFPDSFSVDAAVQVERLSHPIGYWNALGLVAALGIVFCAHLTSSEREPRTARVLAAAALPALASTLLFTFSRAPLAAAAIGVVAYVLIARPRLLVSGLLAAGPTTAVALVASYQADLLASKEPTTAAAAEQGHEVALIVAACVVASAVLRFGLVALDLRLARIRVSPARRRRLALAGAAAAVVVGLVVAVSIDAGARVERQIDRFTESDVGQTGDFRDRLTNPGINRLDHWRIARDAFEDDPLRGQGAGTYALRWDRYRPTESDSEEGHSLYLEVLGELGLPGGLLLIGVLLALLVGVGARTRSPDRPMYAAILTGAIVWALAAGVDWHWEVPAVTLWLFALGGLALAAPGAAPARPRDLSLAEEGPGPGAEAGLGPEAEVGLGPRWPARAGAAAVCVALAATPALVGVSQARLAEAVRAYERGDCAEASSKALDSTDALGNRPEPYELLGYCSAGLGDAALAERYMRRALERDPRNWEYSYGLALVRAAGGKDPRRQLRIARFRNPREPRVIQAQAAFASGDPEAWRRAARAIGLEIR